MNKRAIHARLAATAADADYDHDPFKGAADDLGRLSVALDNAGADDFPEALDAYRDACRRMRALRYAALLAPIVQVGTGMYTRSRT
jgi:hypothetical protein